MSAPLDALTLPLWGSRLIEASAGTGKTWTLAALVLRLVLGHSGDNAFARPLQPAQILVMTFTRAATRELSARIRTRLLQAARCFEGSEVPSPEDEFLIRLLADHPDGEMRAQAARRLTLAAQAMDDVAVHTIDAWCQRMLREHAFDSGSRFDDTLDADETAMRREAALDYWRQQVYPLDDAALAQVLAVWPKAQALVDDAQRLLEQPLPDAAGTDSLADLIARLAMQRQQLKAGWAQRAQEMGHWLDRQVDTSQVIKGKLQARYYRAWLASLTDWADDPTVPEPQMKTGADRLTPAGLAAVAQPGITLRVPSDFVAFEALLRALEQLPSPVAALRAHAAVNIAQRLALLKARAGSFGFADMLNRLDAALDPARNSAAARLRARIREQFPVALIDEFQDTSPVQASIFDRLYGIARNDPATALLLIGDPKQSIYGFRGADIHAYLAARRATEGRRYVLGTNHRSTPALVDAVNAVFMRADSQAEGAFMFRAAGSAAADDLLPFEPVRAHGRDERFVGSAAHGAALGLELDDRLLDAGTSQREFAARCAEHIVQLLNDERVGFRNDTRGEFRRLASADIAVLVRTRRQAADVRRELARRHVSSVYLSDGESVLAGDEARDLLYWLRAVASNGDSRLVRAALATSMIDLTADELLQLASDDDTYDRHAAELRRLRTVWQQQGVLSMLRQTLHRFDLPARWLAAGRQRDGERRLTNHLHLAELLQAASALHPGEQSLIHWLGQERGAVMVDADERIVRLESDADLVKVVTVHKAKGLEYPLVVLPFANHFRPVRKSRADIVVLHDEAGRRQVHLDPDAVQLEAADTERLREDLRLLYVALTRARHCVWVGLAALKSGNSTQCVWHRSAIGYALGGLDPAPADALRAQVEALVRSGDALVRSGDAPMLQSNLAPPIEQLPCTPLRPRQAAPPLRPSLPYAADFDRHWAIGSYSSLVRRLTPPAGWRADALLVRDDELPAVAEPTSLTLAEQPAGDAPWHRLAAGAGTGTVLHALLEIIAADGLDRIDSDDMRRQLLRRCQQLGHGAQAQDLLAWLTELLRTPLPVLGGPLQQVDRVLSEMEFWLPSEGLQSGRVNALCRAHLLGAAPRPALPPRRLHGMLMGFADLVFEHGGRYWVLDYKTNRLARDDAGYHAAALTAAMAAHRYDVQAALYLVALHRLLRARLGPAYDPSRQLGGALFFFVRGLRGPERGCVHLSASPVLLDGLDAALAATGTGVP